MAIKGSKHTNRRLSKLEVVARNYGVYTFTQFVSPLALPKRHKDMAIAYLFSGKTMRDVAADYGVSHEWVRKVSHKVLDEFIDAFNRLD